MIYFCFLDDPSAATPRMELLRATDDAAALTEARGLAGPSGIEGHVFNGDQFVQTIRTEPRFAPVGTRPDAPAPTAPMEAVVTPAAASSRSPAARPAAA